MHVRSESESSMGEKIRIGGWNRLYGLLGLARNVRASCVNVLGDPALLGRRVVFIECFLNTSQGICDRNDDKA